MAFNLGVSNHPISRMGGLSSVGVYLYEDVYYRQWITEIALAFYEGRQDEFVWLDLVRQFRNPEKQQILPVNLTKEIIDEISILYKEDPIYQVVDENGKLLPADQELFNKEVLEKARYLMIMDKIDRWCNLLGTVLLKVSFIDPKTGQLVKETEGGQIQLDVMHGGSYDVKYGASPYYITELLIGFGTKFTGFKGYASPRPGALNISDGNSYGPADINRRQSKSSQVLGDVNRIYWSPESHKSIDEDNNEDAIENPYGIVPAVPFFNMDPAHYYFLPINEPLIYANHALNMRITDLNHIAKFQSFGVPVVTGVERPTSTRQGRPVDDFNILKGGSAQSKFGGLSGFSGFGAGGQYRSFDAGMGIFRDGNADAASLGFTIGPDTAIALGDKGDFKFAHPSADITGLIKSIESIADTVRINHGLRPKFKDTLPASGFARLMEKIGVIDNNRRRRNLFKEREQQLFEVIKRLYNTHHNNSGEQRFSEKARLKITYIEPKFPTDPKTEKEDLMMEMNLLDTEDSHIISKLYPHFSLSDIKKLIRKRREDKVKKTLDDAHLQALVEGILPDKEEDPKSKKKHKYVTKTGTPGTRTYVYDDPVSGKQKEVHERGVTKPKIDNKAKHAEASSIQPGKNGDMRKK